MRLFQNSGLYPAYLKRLGKLRAEKRRRFQEWTSIFLADRYGAAHYLKPVLDGDPGAFFTNGDDAEAQRVWAKERGLPHNESLENILLSQIEHHQAEVFYNLDPLRFGSDFVRKLPGCVKRSFAWRAAPSPGADFGAYDAVLCNFPGIIEGYRRRGWRAVYFSPAHDSEMDRFAHREDRPIDVLFVGGYTRHHRRRADLLEAVASISGEFTQCFHLDVSRATRVAESVLGYFLPIGHHRRPKVIREIARPPVFGMELYGALASAKIVLNCAIDMAGDDRGNMRCFEAMGCGAVLLSDAGSYPEGMCAEENLVIWTSPSHAVDQIRDLLNDESRRTRIALAGRQLMTTRYCKSRQWDDFVRLAS